MPFSIVYPEVNTVSDATMRGWAEDAIANGEIDGPASLSVEDLAMQLHREGLISMIPVELVEDIRDEMVIDCITNHDPDCQCYRCLFGDDAYLFNLHPDEY